MVILDKAITNRPLPAGTLREFTLAQPGAIIFEMGLYKAELPQRLRYSEIHFWFEIEKGQTRCGLSSYAVRLLGDVFRLEWSVRPGDAVEIFAPLGEIESTKASAELYAPLPGTLGAINQDLVDDPSRIALDPYASWLLEFEAEPREAMSAREYRQFLARGWEEIQKLLKGQI